MTPIIATFLALLTLFGCSKPPAPLEIAAPEEASKIPEPHREIWKQPQPEINEFPNPASEARWRADYLKGLLEKRINRE